MREEAAGPQVEKVGKDLRSMMPWIDGLAGGPYRPLLLGAGQAVARCRDSRPPEAARIRFSPGSLWRR